MQEDVFADAALWIAGMWAAACALLGIVSLAVIRSLGRADKGGAKI